MGMMTDDDGLRTRNEITTEDEPKNVTPSTLVTSFEPFLEMCPGVFVNFAEDWNTGIGGGLWSTGLAMAHYLAQHRETVRTNLQRQGKDVSVVELGSGNGFLATCLAAIAPDLLRELVITDTAQHLPLIRKTLEANSHLFRQQEEQSYCCKPVIREYLWGEPFDRIHALANGEANDKAAEKELGGHTTFDVVLGSDLAYRDDLHEPLIASLQLFSNRRTVTLLGISMSDTTPLFFHRLGDAGFNYQRFADHWLPLEYRGTTFGIFLITRKSLPPTRRTFS